MWWKEFNWCATFKSKVWTHVGFYSIDGDNFIYFLFMYVIYVFYILELDRYYNVSLCDCLQIYQVSQICCIMILWLLWDTYRLLYRDLPWDSRH